MPRLSVAAKLAGILVAFVAAPVVLYAVAGNPLPVWPIDWGLVSESLSTGAIATSTWLKVIAVGAWLVWAYLSVAVVMELAATVRGRPSRVRVSAVQWLASTIVALATQIATVDASATAVVPVYNAAAVQGGTGGTAAVDPSPSPVDDGARLIVATEGDSWAGFAASAVGDPAAGAVIRAFNQGRDVGGHVVDGSEAFVEAGWQLAIPAEATTVAVGIDGATDDDADGSEGATRSTAETAAPTTWTVQEGEHFWEMAERLLGEAWGRTPTDEELVPYWEQLIETNRDRLAPPGDPELIYPGQQFIVPAPPPTEDVLLGSADAALVPPDTAPAEPAHRPPHDRPKGSRPPGHSETETRDDLASEPAEATEGTDDRLHDLPADATDDSSPEDVEDVEGELTGWGIPVGMTTGTTATMLLAGGVLGLLRRRRRLALQQRRVHVRLPPLTTDQLVQTGRLAAAAPAGETLDELAELLSSIPAAATPMLVELDDDGSVSLIFERDSQAATSPPAPWTTHEAGHGQERWTAMLGARGPRRSIGLPLLVTLGRHGTTTVLANVDAMRLLVVTASDPSVVRRWLRMFALEAATSLTSGPVEVTVAGDPGWTGIERVRLIDDPAAEVAAAAAEIAQPVIADDRLPRLIVCHDPADVPPLPPELNLVGIIAAERPTSTARWRLHLDETSCVLHGPDGIQIALDTPDFDPDLVTNEVAALADSHAAASPVEHGGRAGAMPSPPADPSHDLSATPDDRDSPEDNHTEPVGEAQLQRGWCEVGLLGRVTVTCGDVTLETLSPTVGQVLAYLATHPDTTSEQLENAVWAGLAAGSGHRVRSALRRLRSELGDTPDGEPLLPRRAPREQTIRLSSQIATDLGRAIAHLDAAAEVDGHERLDQLLAALALVRGAPFEDMPVSWATDIAHRAVARLQDAALDAANGLLAAGRLDDAEHAVTQGLKLCDPCEPLYVAWAQIEHARDRRHRIPQLWARLRQRYADEADETFDIPTAPTADTKRAFAALTGRTDTHQ